MSDADPETVQLQNHQAGFTAILQYGGGNTQG
jgi:hypothetical protein